MLAWACDIIITSDDAEFRDPVVEMGVCDVEFFAHPWEVGVRKAKELLFTADWLGAEEARQLGMVNQVVARDDLLPTALAMAERIAKKPLFALKMTKEAVNQPRTPRAVPAPWRGSLLCISYAIATTSPCGLKKALAAGWRGPDPRLDHPKNRPTRVSRGTLVSSREAK